MSRRMRVHIERLVVESGSVLDRRAFAAALQRQLTRQLRAPQADADLHARRSASMDAGEARGTDAEALASQIGAQLPGGGRR